MKSCRRLARFLKMSPDDYILILKRTRHVSIIGNTRGMAMAELRKRSIVQRKSIVLYRWTDQKAASKGCLIDPRGTGTSLETHLSSDLRSQLTESLNCLVNTYKWPVAIERHMRGMNVLSQLPCPETLTLLHEQWQFPKTFSTRCTNWKFQFLKWITRRQLSVIPSIQHGAIRYF